MLLEKGADVNAQGGLYSNALQAASGKGEKEIVGVLLEKRADVNAQGGPFGNALQAASGIGEKEIVGMLLEKGADVNARADSTATRCRRHQLKEGDRRDAAREGGRR